MSLELEVGELKGRFSGMETRMKDLEKKFDTLDTKVDKILEKVSEVRGGWKLLAGVSAASVVVGGFLIKFWRLL